MATQKRHNYTQLAIHATFGTTGRKRWIDEDIEIRVWDEVRRIVERAGCGVWAVGGVDDQVHLLFELPVDMTVADVIGREKGGSSRWIRKTRPHIDFTWQRGYGAFAVSARDVAGVKRYIRNQREHHMRFDYAAELERLSSED